MINKYTLNEDKQYKYLKRNGTKLFCFKQDSVIGCGSWCPAFLVKDKKLWRDGKNRVLLRCIEQQFIIEKD